MPYARALTTTRHCCGGTHSAADAERKSMQDESGGRVSRSCLRARRIVAPSRLRLLLGTQLLALAALALAAAADNSSSSVTLQMQLVDGQPLADAVAQWGAVNADLTYTLSPSTITSLANATFKRTSGAQAAGGKAYANGTFTIRGPATSTATATGGATVGAVLDAAQRTGLTPLLTQARVRVVDAGLIGLCLTELPLVGLTLATPLLMAIFTLNPVVKVLSMDGAVVYIPKRTLAMSVYLALAESTGPAANTWPEVTRAFSSQLGIMSSVSDDSYVPRMTAHEMAVWNGISPAMEGNFTFRSLEAPDDPVLSFMRDRGLVAPLRFCGNRSLVPDAWSRERLDLWWGPLWMSDRAEDVAAGLVNVTALAPAQHAAQRPVPGVLLALHHTPLPDGAVPGAPLQLSGPMALWGPSSQDSRGKAARDPPVVDLTGRTVPLWNVSAADAGQLLISRLVIRVPSSSLPDTNLTSAVPLAALAVASESGSRNASAVATIVQLHNVTLELPVADFLALLTLATDGTSSSVRQCVDAPTLQLAAALAPGVQALRPDVASWDVLHLVSYSAWGVSATKLTVRPQTPVPAAVIQRCIHPPPPPSASTPGAQPPAGGGGSGSSRTVGIAVGCAVGGALLIAGTVVAAAVLLKQRRAARRSAESPQGSDTDRDDVFLDMGQGPKGTSGASEHGDGATTTDASPSHAAAAAAAPESRLVALVHSQERLMLQDALPPPGEPGSMAVSDLNQVHSQLINSVMEAGGPLHKPASACRPPRATATTRAPDASPAPSWSGTHRDAVEQAATRLAADSADKIELQKVLGRGGGGIVYRGLWRGLPVAIKTMVFESWDRGDGEDEERAAGPSRLRFMRAIMETAISASVGHPNVVATYHYDVKRLNDQRTDQSGAGLQVVEGSGASDGAPAAPSGPAMFKIFLVQELCSCSLATALDRAAFGDEDKGTMLAMLQQVACGLAYLHSQGIIHGDLTPGNVLLKVDKDSKTVVVKLADFGLSQRLDAQATHVSNFNSGTPFYVAPEVVLSKRLSPASDVYSWAILAWVLLAQQPPCIEADDGTSKPNPLFPRFPRAMEPPVEVHALFKRCLSRKPHERPTAAELAKVLSPFLNLSPLDAPHGRGRQGT